jgi:dTDP-glucose 4,6-dehydratase
MVNSHSKEKMKKIVYVTGCLGFIGVHVTRACLAKGWYVIGVDKGTYASNWNFLTEFNASPNFKFIKSDINDLTKLYDCDYIINTAAETHVDNSIEDSDQFVHSNVNGVHHLLKLIKQKSHYAMPTLLHFSTDEVYGDLVEGFHKESDMLKPSNPYSATKAAADMLILGWARTHKVPYVIVRPTNNYGVGQYVEKLIPKSVKYLSLDRKIDIHNNGTPVRTWLHVSDTANAIITIVESGVKNDIFNISGNFELPNIVVVRKIIEEVKGSVTDLEPFLQHMSRPGQDLRYAIDDSKLKALGWTPKAVFDDELQKIVKYYLSNFVW